MSDPSVSDSESTEEDDGVISRMELREVDVEEVEAVKNFVDNACGCSKKGGAPCSGYFDQKGI